MSNASFKQAAHLLTFVGQKDPELEQLQLLYNSGLLSDLLDGNIAEVDRDEFRKVLGLCPLDKKIVEAVRETLPGIIRVDRSTRPTYPDFVDVEWINDPKFVQLEATGPEQYSIDQIEQWLHEGQKNSTVAGNIIYEYMKKHEMLESCLGLTDLLAIQKLGLAFFREHFQNKAVFGCKSVVRGSGGRLDVPSLYESDGEVGLFWVWLGCDWDASDPALRFAR